MSVEIGRVLRANTQGFAFGCRASQLETPYFGGLVKADAGLGQCVYGLIYDFRVDDDPLVRRLVLAEDLPVSAIEDQRSNRMLPIEMSVLSVGYVLNERIRHGLPPRPPLNLDPVMMVIDADEIRRFSDQKGYLRLIMRAAEVGVPVAQLLVAHINSVYELRGRDDRWVLTIVEEIIALLRNDYETLVPTLEALSEALPIIATLTDAEPALTG